MFGFFSQLLLVLLQSMFAAIVFVAPIVTIARTIVDIRNFLQRHQSLYQRKFSTEKKQEESQPRNTHIEHSPTEEGIDHSEHESKENDEPDDE